MERRQRVDKSKNKNQNKKKLIVIVLITLFFIIAGTIFAIKIFNKPKQEIITAEKVEKIIAKKVEIFNGDDRPIAVMIDNNTNAWPHSGVDKAYIVYEIIVEARRD